VKPLLLMILTAGLVALTACGGSSTETSSMTRGPISESGSAQRAGSSPQDIDHISTYGREAGEPDRREIITLVSRYYAAAAADDGSKACSMIYSLIANSVAEDYGQPPGPPYLRGKTCPIVMSKLFRHVPGQTPATLAATRVTGVRLLPRQGFAQLSSKAMPTGEIFVQRQGKAWKVGALIGRECTNCIAQDATGLVSTVSHVQISHDHLKGDNDDDENGEEVGQHVDSDNDADVRSDRLDKNTGYRDGDDGRISEYGQAIGRDEQAKLTAIADSYFAAASAGDGASVCSLIDPALVKTIPEDYGRPPGPRYMHGKTCAASMSGLFRHFHGHFSGGISVTGVRVMGHVAYVLLGSRTQPASYMTLKRKQKTWRIDGLVATPLP
jgi:hypothetical protein